VLALLADAPRGADELVRLCALGPAEVGRALVELELVGLASEGDGLYRAAL
jgi:DNA-binding IclR family transcriptional regulator